MRLASTLLVVCLTLVISASVDYATLFYDIAVSRANCSSEAFLPQVHLLRIPKASSSSLSAVARRFAGCVPAGPCCRWPGDPPGTCPSKELFACQQQNRVVGCTHHYPHYDSLLDARLPSISVMREPRSRALSAFFYPGIHHNSKCAGSREACFREYTGNSRWRDVAVKMLTGLYAYAPDEVCRLAAQCGHSLQLAEANLARLHHMGVAELWELSLLLLHLRTPGLRPHLDEFRLGEGVPKVAAAIANNATAGRSNTATSRRLAANGRQSHEDSDMSPVQLRRKLAGASRANHGEDYQEFRSSALERFDKELREQNGLDMELYAAALARLCGELHTHELWAMPLVRQYWREKAPQQTGKCS